ncbi:PLP-dependent transferase [Salinicola tamaricis]|uniref:PLP-dependent transferase n=1 Tax=Salinicola tamaricis TaxID=1771309 RepID=UPI0024141A5B|nr:PLP-dependent transferase [Salinicola tamaricis]
MHAAGNRSASYRPAPIGPASVNPPVVRTSTVTFDSLAQMRDTKRRREQGERPFSYGRRGTPTTYALEDAVSRLEGAEQTLLTPSGVAAINLVLMTLPGPALRSSSPIASTSRCDASSMGGCGPGAYASTTSTGSVAHLQSLLTDDTCLVYTEVPGSLVYEMQDLPALAALTSAREIRWWWTTLG